MLRRLAEGGQGVTSSFWGHPPECRAARPSFHPVVVSLRRAAIGELPDKVKGVANEIARHARQAAGTSYERVVVAVNASAMAACISLGRKLPSYGLGRLGRLSLRGIDCSQE